MTPMRPVIFLMRVFHGGSRRSRHAVTAMLAGLSILGTPRSLADCSICTGITLKAAITGPGKLDIQADTVSCGTDDRHQNTKCFKIKPGVTYHGTFSAVASNNESCTASEASVELSASCTGLVFIKPSGQLWNLAQQCKGGSPVTLNAVNWDKWNPACVSPPTFCTHANCTHHAGCPCSCRQEPIVTQVFLCYYYIAYSRADVFVDWSYAESDEEANQIIFEAIEAQTAGGQFEFIGMDNIQIGSCTLVFKDLNNLRSIDVDPNVPIQPSTGLPDLFKEWGPFVQVDELSGEVPCECYLLEQQYEADLQNPPQSISYSFDVMGWMPDNDPRQDEGESNAVGPDGSGGPGMAEGGGGNTLATAVDMTFGMGRTADGKAPALLSFGGQLNDPTMLAPGQIHLLNPFGDSIITESTHPRPLGTSPAEYYTYSTITGNGLSIAQEYRTSPEGGTQPDNDVRITFKNASTNEVVAVHHLTWMAAPTAAHPNENANGMPGLRHVRTRNGLTQTWEYYGTSDGESRTYREIHPDGTVIDGINPPKVVTNLSTDETMRTSSRSVWKAAHGNLHASLVGSQTETWNQIVNLTHLGELKTSTEVTLPDQPSLRTTYDYWAGGLTCEGKLKSVTHPDGWWGTLRLRPGV